MQCGWVASNLAAPRKTRLLQPAGRGEQDSDFMLMLSSLAQDSSKTSLAMVSGLRATGVSSNLRGVLEDPSVGLLAGYSSRRTGETAEKMRCNLRFTKSCEDPGSSLRNCQLLPHNSAREVPTLRSITEWSKMMSKRQAEVVALLERLHMCSNSTCRSPPILLSKPATHSSPLIQTSSVAVHGELLGAGLIRPSARLS